MTEKRPWRQIFAPTRASAEIEAIWGDESDEAEICNNQSKYYDEMWKDRSQQWQQMGAWMANVPGVHESSGQIALEIGTHMSAASPEVVHDRKNGKSIACDINCTTKLWSSREVECFKCCICNVQKKLPPRPRAPPMFSWT